MPWVPILFIAAGVFAYWNSFQGVWLLDDISGIVENPALRMPGDFFQNFLGLFRLGRPVTDLTLLLNFQISDLNPWGYHLLNLGIHLACGFLLYGILRGILGARSGGVLSGGLTRGASGGLKGGSRNISKNSWRAKAISVGAVLLWLVHPLQTQAVTYVIQRAESLVVFFYLATFYGAIKAWKMGVEGGQGKSGHEKRGLEKRELDGRGLDKLGVARSGMRWQIFSVCACALGMATKQVMLTAPFLVLFFDVVFVSGGVFKAFRMRWPYYLALLLTLGIQPLVVAMGPPDLAHGFTVKDFAWWQYGLTQPSVILHYLRLVLWPDVLCLNYSWPAAAGFGEVWGSWLVLLFAVGVGAVSLFSRRWRRPWLGGLIFGFFVVLAPSSSFYPIKDLAFEHRMYLPLAFCTVGGSAGLAWIAERLSRKWVYWALLALLVVPLVARTSVRNLDYQSAERIWSKNLQARPQDPRAINEYANALLARGVREEALSLFQSARRVEPENMGPEINIGTIYLDLGKSDEALKAFHRVLKEGPNPEALFGIGNTYFQLKKYEAAVENYRKAIELVSSQPRYYTGLGMALAELGRNEEALQMFLEALRFDPNSPNVHHNLGTIYLRLHQELESRRHYERAAELARGAK